MGRQGGFWASMTHFVLQQVHSGTLGSVLRGGVCLTKLRGWLGRKMPIYLLY